MSEKRLFKKDEYSKSRNSYSRLLEVSCRKCNGKVLLYQKDGPGALHRLYFDRIYSLNKLNEMKLLKCGKCGEILGTPYIYAKEKRKAFRLYQDAVIKKLRKLNNQSLDDLPE